MVHVFNPLFRSRCCAKTSLFFLLESAGKVQALRLLIYKAAQWNSLPLPEFATMMQDLENAAIYLETIADR